MTKPARLVRERIDPRLTAALFANYRTPVDAVLELVDNAVDSRMDGRTHERGKPVAAELGYVRIEVGGVDRKVDVRRLRARLGGTYRPLLERGDVMMRLDRAPVTPLRWTLEERHDISVRAGGRVVHGWWGLLPDPLPLSQPEAGIRLYHLGRLVGSPEWFGHPGPAQHPALNRLVGEVELPHVAVTMNKGDVDRGSEAWASVEERLHRLLAPVVGRLTRDVEVAPSASALRTADQVRRILARALRLLESGKLFESELGGAGGEGPGGQLTLDFPPLDPGSPTWTMRRPARRPTGTTRRRRHRAGPVRVRGGARAWARWSSAPWIRVSAARWSSRMACGAW